MALTFSEQTEPGSAAPDFRLPGVDGRIWSLGDFAGARALVIVFMCNHCPYVIAVRERINRLAQDYGPRGVGVVGINSNDASRYPDDSFEAMKKVAREQGYVFPYLFDEDQAVAKAYGAVCTPDFYVYEGGSGFSLRYRGRLDDSWKDPAAVKSRDLAAALDAILAGKPVASDQPSSMGCSIKWRE
jgi:peroxiredoxin